MYNSANPIPIDKFEEFRKEVLALSKKTFGESSDGNSVIQLFLIDRTRFRDIHFRPLPLTKSKTALDKNGETKIGLLLQALEDATFNVSYAADEFGEFSEKLNFKIEDS